MELSRDDIITILNTVQASGYRHFTLEAGDLRIALGDTAPRGEAAEPRPPVSAETPVAALSPEADKPAEPASSAGHHVLVAPVVGVFYRSPSPDEPVFVQPGDHVTVGDTVGLIEVMKVYNSVACDVTGTVREVLVENNTGVEYGQPLLVIEPDTVAPNDG